MATHRIVATLLELQILQPVQSIGLPIFICNSHFKTVTCIEIKALQSQEIVRLNEDTVLNVL